MKYLLDVNALVALAFLEHSFHDQVTDWLLGENGRQLLTCSITELGFVRVMSQTRAYETNVNSARILLSDLKTERGLSFGFIEDGNDISHLPVWVKTGKQTTDGHLVELAAAHGAVLATLDSGIPGAFLIP